MSVRRVPSGCDAEGSRPAARHEPGSLDRKAALRAPGSVFSGACWSPNKHIRGDAESFDQKMDRRKRRGTTAVQDLPYPPPAHTEERGEIGGSEVALFHAEANRINWSGRGNRNMFAFVGFGEPHKDLEPVVLRRSGRGVPKVLDLAERLLIFPIVANRPEWDGRLLRWSGCRCGHSRHGSP